jgi:hypothetical protein
MTGPHARRRFDHIPVSGPRRVCSAPGCPPPPPTVDSRRANRPAEQGHVTRTGFKRPKRYTPGRAPRLVDRLAYADVLAQVSRICVRSRSGWSARYQLPGQVMRLADADVSGDCSAPLARFELAAIVWPAASRLRAAWCLGWQVAPPQRIDAPNDGFWLCTAADGWPLEAQHPHLINARSRHAHEVSQQGRGAVDHRSAHPTPAGVPRGS